MNEWSNNDGKPAHSESTYHAPVMGKIVGADESGLLVTFDGRPPVPARLFAVGASLCDLMAPENIGRDVMISCLQGDPFQPVITGVAADVLSDLVHFDAETPGPEIRNVARVDGRQIVIEGQDEVVLKCGKSSITLLRDGKIVLKGKELLSRASGTNRIKGGSVGIN